MMEYQRFPADDESAFTKKVIQLALDAGTTQLTNGAEIWRVEDTIAHICGAYKVQDVDAFILSNAIFITGNNEKEAVFAKVKHIPLAGVHLGIVAEVNDLSREISSGNLSVEEAAEKLENIRKIAPKPPVSRGIASGIGAGCFCYILGGTLLESIIAVIIGFLVLMFTLWMDNHNIPKLVKNVLGGGACAFLALTATFVPVFVGASVDKIIIGAIMPLIPGVAFVNSIRDIADSDFISGSVRMLDTIMVFMYIAIGASTVLSIYHGILAGGGL